MTQEMLPGVLSAERRSTAATQTQTRNIKRQSPFYIPKLAFMLRFPAMECGPQPVPTVFDASRSRFPLLVRTWRRPRFVDSSRQTISPQNELRMSGFLRVEVLEPT